MILPTNGKVVIFDDKYSDVQNLLASLSKQKIPYFYFQDEGGSDLPETPIENIRLVFLDLELVLDSKSQEQNIVSFIGGRLSRVLVPNANYVLVYWSTNEDKYRELIDKAFEDRLSDYKPILKISLNKIEAKLQGTNSIEYITKEIIQNTEDFKVLKVFSFWENLINDSSGNLINAFTDFISKDNSWDEVAKHLLYKLAYAYSGKNISELKEIDKIKNAYYTLNHTFIDSIENLISKSLDSKESEFVDVISSTGNLDFISKINTKLLISEDSHFGNVPGTTFFLDEENIKKENVINGNLKKVKENLRIPDDKRDHVILKAEECAKEDKKNIKFQTSLINKNYNTIVNSLLNDNTRNHFEEIFNDSIKIELNISPICDYAQNKMPCCRILPGILLNDNYKSLINQNNAYNYISDAMIEVDGKNYWFVFDFRYLYSLTDKNAKKRISKFRLRQQLLADVQLKLGSHINRAGVLYL